MVTRVRSRAVACGLIVGCALLGCAGDDALGSSAGVGVYLVVTRDVPDPDETVPAPDSALRGLIVTLRSPFAAEYREIGSARMTRRADGARFDLQVDARRGSVAVANRFIRLDSIGNLALPWAAGPGGLGRQSIQAGDIIDFEVVTADQTIVGSSVVPATPAIQISTVDGATTMSWSRPASGGSFVLRVDTDGLPGARIVTTDTSYVIRRDRAPSDVPDPAIFEVTVLDANASRYLRDSTVVRAGLSAGFGVFGASSRGRVTIPPRFAVSSSPVGARNTSGASASMSGRWSLTTISSSPIRMVTDSGRRHRSRSGRAARRMSDAAGSRSMERSMADRFARAVMW
jgi:hypothetical protein